jgi:hypothetical protein
LFLLIILWNLILYSLVDLDFPYYRNLNDDLILNDLSSMRSNDETFMGLLNEFFLWNWNLRNVFFRYLNSHIIRSLNILVDVNPLLNLSVALSLNDLFHIHVSGLLDYPLNNVINVISVLNYVLNRLLDGHLERFLDNLLNHYWDFLN